MQGPVSASRPASDPVACVRSNSAEDGFVAGTTPLDSIESQTMWCSRKADQCTRVNRGIWGSNASVLLCSSSTARSNSPTCPPSPPPALLYNENAPLAGEQYRNDRSMSFTNLEPMPQASTCLRCPASASCLGYHDSLYRQGTPARSFLCQACRHTEARTFEHEDGRKERATHQASSLLSVAPDGSWMLPAWCMLDAKDIISMRSIKPSDQGQCVRNHHMFASYPAVATNKLHNPLLDKSHWLACWATDTASRWELALSSKAAAGQAL